MVGQGWMEDQEVAYLSSQLQLLKPIRNNVKVKRVPVQRLCFEEVNQRALATFLDNLVSFQAELVHQAMDPVTSWR